MVKFKKCSLCKEVKESIHFHKKSDSKDGLHPYCKECSKIKVKERIERDPYTYRLNVMASTILKRLKYCHNEKYKHLKCYKDNNVKCFLGTTRQEIAETLHKYFEKDIKKLMSEGKTPSVDRINPTGNYELKNIRIIDYIENGKQGFINANNKRKKSIKVLYEDGKVEVFESIREAARKLNTTHSTIRYLIKTGNISKKYKFKVEQI